MKKIYNFYKGFKHRDSRKILVSYQFSKNTTNGFGHVELNISNKTLNTEEIRVYIEKKQDFDSVVILNILNIKGGN